MRQRHVVIGALWLVWGCTEASHSDRVPPLGVTEVDLGPISSDMPFKMTIPENALGFQLVAQVDGSAGTEPIGISSLVSPSGAMVVADFSSPGDHVPFQTELGIVAVSIPQTSATAKEAIEAGEWTVTASIGNSAPAHAKLFVRTTEDGQFHGGALDLRLYIPDGLLVVTPSEHAITTATAASDPTIAMQIDSFYATLKQLYDLDRGNVEFVSLPGELAQITDLTKRNQALMMTTPSTSGPAAQFVLVDALSFENGNTAWGLTPWNPGTAMTTGHPMAGVFVNISLSKSPAADGMTMVHELGHFSGLYHTTEGDRTYHDPLDDTPECQPGASVCPDGHNIMFVTFYGASGGGLGLMASDQQRRVMWGSPLYHQ
jgi:hypothetical protein